MHIAPSELMEFEAQDLAFWLERLEEFAEWQQQENPTL
jgi:hypothetical protein